MINLIRMKFEKDTIYKWARLPQIFASKEEKCAVKSKNLHFLNLLGAFSLFGCKFLFENLYLVAQ